MGEIRTQVRLVNAVDEELSRSGRCPPESVRSYVADAVVGTGAVRSVIPVHVMEKLGVSARGERVAQYADGRKDVVRLTGGVIFEVMGRDTVEEALVLGDEVLIGQTVLGKLDLMADCANQRLVPNPAHPDQPVSKIRQLRMI